MLPPGPNKACIFVGLSAFCGGGDRIRVFGLGLYEGYGSPTWVPFGVSFYTPSSLHSSGLASSPSGNIVSLKPCKTC